MTFMDHNIDVTKCSKSARRQKLRLDIQRPGASYEIKLVLDYN